MKLCYYRSDVGNFGDDLNEWLWPRILPADLLNSEDGISLVGFGTILHDKFFADRPLSAKKVIAGSGVRFLDRPLTLDQSWSICFLRGPISALLLKRDVALAVTDGAYCLSLTPQYSDLIKSDKKYPVAVMPHFRSTFLLDWSRLCRDLGVHYIDSTSPHGVESTIREISETRLLLTEALHGAVIADALRVPWARFRFNAMMREGIAVSELKWLDWLQSLSLAYHSLDIRPSVPPRVRRMLGVRATRTLRMAIVRRGIKQMLESSNWQLSRDSVHESVTRQLRDRVRGLVREYPHL